jgi:succinoglycan biosynthesis protein ExoA
MISLICPVYNEQEYIDSIIKFFISSSIIEKELFLIDGGSTDNTIQIIKEKIKNYPNVYLLQNENKYVPFALNMGIKLSKGNPIIRLDAHTEYFDDYIEKIIQVLNETNADIVGGPMIKVGKNIFQKAVAFCTSSKLGIGNSKIHQIDYEGPSDHVYLGAWKRELFEEIGYFDERFIRNQDDEFHYRAKSLKKKIILSSEIKSKYYPRNSIRSLFKQYFQYGLFKPLVLKKIKTETKLRHFIPSLFVLYVLTTPIWSVNIFFSVVFFLYFVLVSIFMIKSRLPLRSRTFCYIIYPTIHLAYGLGFLIGLFWPQKHLKWFIV